MTAPANIWAVVPVKSFSSAKTRLANTLQADERNRLSRAMMSDVLKVLLASPRLAATVVVTSDNEVADCAKAAGAHIFREQTSRGPAQAVTTTAQWLADQGCQGMLGIMADLPAINESEIDKLLTSHDDLPAVTLAPSYDGTGTNAVVCTPPDIIGLSFGANSLASHLASAKNSGIQANIVNLPGIGLDLDHREDLQTFMKYRLDTHTSRYLRELGIEEEEQ